MRRGQRPEKHDPYFLQSQEKRISKRKESSTILKAAETLNKKNIKRWSMGLATRALETLSKAVFMVWLGLEA